MRRSLIRWLGMLAVVMLLLGSAGSLQAAPHTPQDWTPVAVVEDKTTASGCLQSTTAS